MRDLIVVNGRLRCLGSAQHLKHRFGNGFEVNIKTQAPTEESLLNALKVIRSRTNIGALVSSAPIQNPIVSGMYRINKSNRAMNIYFLLIYRYCISLTNKYIYLLIVFFFVCL